LVKLVFECEVVIEFLPVVLADTHEELLEESNQTIGTINQFANLVKALQVKAITGLSELCIS